MAEDKIIVDHLGGGRIKITTDEVSGPNHMAAENALAYLARLMGGPVERKSRGKMAVHSHTHDQTHSHEH